MEEKYEVTYYNWVKGEEFTELYTNFLIQALWTVRKLHKDWYCVTIKFKRRSIPGRRKGVVYCKLPLRN